MTHTVDTPAEEQRSTKHQPPATDRPAPRPSHPQRPPAILHLQARAGNAAVSRLLASGARSGRAASGGPASGGLASAAVSPPGTTSSTSTTSGREPVSAVDAAGTTTAGANST